ncbi:MAG: triose-phosphate isomerase [Candidatus Diapherotrites archaeon]|nr:triose-phosphate isomerase [Candidatus Diapherotrites archaeon]
MLKLKKPVLFINLKTYEAGTGAKALELARIADAIAEKKDREIVLVAQACDIRLLSQNCTLPIFAQHVDPISYGAHTGHILPEAVKQAGASGTVLNHAENKRTNEFLERAIIRAREAGLFVMCCAESLERAKQIASFNVKPDLIAVEPPELVGTGIAVSTAKPELITGIVEGVGKIANIPIVAGAGIKSASDVKRAIELGCVGVFVASAIVKADNKKEAILELLSGFE